MILNFGMHNCGPKLYYVYKKDESLLTFTYFTAKSNLISDFKWGKRVCNIHQIKTFNN